MSLDREAWDELEEMHGYFTVGSAYQPIEAARHAADDACRAAYLADPRRNEGHHRRTYDPRTEEYRDDWPGQWD